jgi:hypothetical protein
MVEEIIRAYTNNPVLVGISGVTFLFGYLEYILAVRIIMKEKRAPYPVWMHTFYLAHDVTAGTVFLLLARQYHGFWFFRLGSVGLYLWNIFEIYCLYAAVRYERQEIWGKFYDSEVTARQAVLRVVGQIVMMFCVVNLFRVYMHDDVMFKWFSFTNILIAIAPGYLWNERKTRRGTSIELAVVIVLGTANTFLPPGLGMWTTASRYFDHPLFYLTGVVCTAYALRNLWVVIKKPREAAPDCVTSECAKVSA